MTASFPHPLDANAAAAASPLTNWRSFLLEPLLIAGACLFWIAILPVTGLFCAGVAVYDKLASLKASPLRVPDLRSCAANNPLVLRKTRLERTPTPTTEAIRALQP